MSGGAFNYAYSRVNIFVDELSSKLNDFDKVDDWSQKPNLFLPEVLAKLKEIQATVEHAAKLMREVEWLYSGDTGDDTFMRRVAEIEAKQGPLI